MKSRSQLFLENISVLEQKIDELKFELDALEKNRIYIRAVNFDKLPGGGRAREASFEKVGDKIADLTRELDAKMAELAEARHNAIALIHSLENHSQSRVLFLRYVKRLSFDQLSAELGYAESHVFMLHRNGLAELDKLLCGAVRK